MQSATTPQPQERGKKAAQAPGQANEQQPPQRHEPRAAHGVSTLAGQQVDRSQIQGWGADLDPATRPGYPMERKPPRVSDGVHWSEPEQQPQHMTVFHSNERPGMTHVFGTSVGPRGLSGKVRELAFRLSENDLRHWLLLLLADRINVVEGIGDDLRQGHIPNIFAEMGLKSEWKYNRAGLIRKAAVGTVIAGAAWYLMSRRQRDRQRYR